MKKDYNNNRKKRKFGDMYMTLITYFQDGWEDKNLRLDVYLFGFVFAVIFLILLFLIYF